MDARAADVKKSRRFTFTSASRQPRLPPPDCSCPTSEARIRLAALLVVLADAGDIVAGQGIPANEVLAVYRLRWQIELAFKRLKSLIEIENVHPHPGWNPIWAVCEPDCGPAR